MEKKTKTISKMLKATKRQNIDFEYVVQRPSKAKICFGSTQHRGELRHLSRHGIQFTYPTKIFQTPKTQPAAADISTSPVVAKKDIAMTGRTAQARPTTPEETSPGPAAFKVNPIVENKAYSFSIGPRFRTTHKCITVGPGYYKPSSIHRTIEFAECFGGKRRLIPAVQLKCGPFNYDVCERCKRSPVGDYWQMTSPVTTFESDVEIWYLCRNCYTIERRQPTRFTRQQLSYFKKVRDCSKVHFHDGCEARLLLLPPRDMEKIREKEAYLSLYFP